MRKEMDLFAYRTKPKSVPRIDKMAKRAMRMGDISLRQFDMKRYNQEIELLVEIFNDAWSGNWGFVPFSRAEIDVTGGGTQAVFPQRVWPFSAGEWQARRRDRGAARS